MNNQDEKIIKSELYQTYECRKDATLKPMVIEASIKNAENLPKMDILGKCDAYVSLYPLSQEESPDSSKVSSRAVFRNYNPVWDQTLETILPLNEQKAEWLNDGPTAYLFDYDTYSTDDYIGKVRTELTLGEYLSECAAEAFEQRNLKDQEDDPFFEERIPLKSNSREHFGHLWESKNIMLSHENRFRTSVEHETNRWKAFFRGKVTISIPSQLLNPELMPSSKEENFISKRLIKELDNLCEKREAELKEAKQKALVELEKEQREKKRVEQWIQNMETYVQEDLPPVLDQLHRGSCEADRDCVVAVVADCLNLSGPPHRSKATQELWIKHINGKNLPTEKEMLAQKEREEKVKAEQKKNKESNRENSDSNPRKRSCEIVTVHFNLDHALRWRSRRLFYKEDEHVIIMISSYPIPHPDLKRQNFDVSSGVHLAHAGKWLTRSITLFGYRRYIVFDNDEDYESLESDSSSKQVHGITVSYTGQEKLASCKMVTPNNSTGIFMYQINIPEGKKSKRYGEVSEAAPFVIDASPSSSLTISDCHFAKTIIRVQYAKNFTMRNSCITLTGRYKSPIRIGPPTEVFIPEEASLDDYKNLSEEYQSDLFEYQRSDSYIEKYRMFVSIVNCRIRDAQRKELHSGIHLSSKIRMSIVSHIRGCTFDAYTDVIGDGLRTPIIVNDVDSPSLIDEVEEDEPSDSSSLADEDRMTGKAWLSSNICSGNKNEFNPEKYKQQQKEEYLEHLRRKKAKKQMMLNLVNGISDNVALQYTRSRF
eukprot:gb/GECH01004034.1/.p1 GENE.gb/GECH01004034.1/~~gb/GECH01004034.1/.p1  ORF type:complete len:766 (+),score=212.31 gb/GECH01004034.1/:1-2298(+)